MKNQGTFSSNDCNLEDGVVLKVAPRPYTCILLQCVYFTQLITHRHTTLHFKTSLFTVKFGSAGYTTFFFKPSSLLSRLSKEM